MYGILNTGAVTTDIFITSTCGDTIMTTENKSVNFLNTTKNYNFGGGPTGGAQDHGPLYPLNPSRVRASDLQLREAMICVCVCGVTGF